MPIDLVVIPYHDWRKVCREGARTRDAHLIEQFMRHPDVGKVVIVNRPMSLPEMVYKRVSWKTPGKVIRASGRTRIVKIRDNAFAVDYFEASIVSPIAGRKQWFLKAYGQSRFVRTISECLQRLEVRAYSCVSFNVFASDLMAALPATSKLFDGWDNFARFPEHAAIRERLLAAYQTYSEAANCWTTNSHSNQEYYKSNFAVKQCHLIPNGVDPERFEAQGEIPPDMRSVPRPVVGFGAKVTHLLDRNLINHLTLANPNVSFVMVGQVLEKDVFRRIEKRPNFFYLGDKRYDLYPSYVRAFDVCIIPYVVGEKEHGGDSIKFYEYLAAGKPVVTTAIEGISDQFGNTLIARDRVEFSAMIGRALSEGAKPIQLPERVTWKYKGNELINALKLSH